MDKVSPEKLKQWEEIIERCFNKRLFELMGFNYFPNSPAPKLIDFEFMKTEQNEFYQTVEHIVEIIDAAFDGLPPLESVMARRARTIAKFGPELFRWVSAIAEAGGYNSTAAKELLRSLNAKYNYSTAPPYDQIAPIYDEVAALKLALSEQKRRADEFERRWNEIRIRSGAPADATIKEVYEHLFPDWIWNKAQAEPHPQYNFSDLTDEQKQAVELARNQGYTRIRKCLQALADGRTVLIGDLHGRTVDIPGIPRT